MRMRGSPNGAVRFSASKDFREAVANSGRGFAPA
ncbi:hypothetical protein GGR03_001802 [Aurantimonas endophytica]|uniref:Uncharacterized protein n=1 Tax=Aurantimonas endophytica TaxID=1522175 RepID=A0A7W6HCW4_9HYPH|nr:hypothetical protein [Aurantimonas endophytica]